MAQVIGCGSIPEGPWGIPPVSVPDTIIDGRSRGRGHAALSGNTGSASKGRLRATRYLHYLATFVRPSDDSPGPLRLLSPSATLSPMDESGQGTTVVEEFWELQYRMEGWDPETGWPTLAKLAELGIEWAARPGDAW